MKACKCRLIRLCPRPIFLASRLRIWPVPVRMGTFWTKAVNTNNAVLLVLTRASAEQPYTLELLDKMVVVLSTDLQVTRCRFTQKT